MKRIILLLTAICVSACSAGETTNPDTNISTATNSILAVQFDDFRILEGDDWTGQLTYLNYGTTEKSTIPVNLKVRIPTEGTLAYDMIFPKEPQANSSSQLIVSEDGTRIDDKPVIDRTVREDGTVIVRTRYEDWDNNQPATVRMSYILAAEEFRMKKEVRFEGGEFFERNEFLLTRERS